MATVKRSRSRNDLRPDALRRYRQEYQRLKRQLETLGYVCLGSITRRWITCGNPACACHRDPNRRHGPYYQWTRKIGGRTETRMLDESLLRLYQEGIRNHRRLDAILEKMREVSLAAFEAVKIQSKS